MDIEAILKDKNIKTKAKVETISQLIVTSKIKTDDVIKVATKSKDTEKGTCLEALELATRTNPDIANQKCMSFATSSLGEKAPRVKWEAAKVIGNIAALYKAKLDEAISGLLINTEHPGTVVRWSSAYALGKIILCQTKHNTELIPAAEAIIKREENNAIKKIYLAALKKVQKK